MSLDKSRFGVYKIYKTLVDMDVEYTSLFGKKYVKHVKAGSKIYESIDYKQNLRTHYFLGKPGMGGFQVATIHEVENSPDRFKYVGTVEYN